MASNFMWEAGQGLVQAKSQPQGSINATTSSLQRNSVILHSCEAGSRSISAAGQICYCRHPPGAS